MAKEAVALATTAVKLAATHVIRYLYWQKQLLLSLKQLSHWHAQLSLATTTFTLAAPAVTTIISSISCHMAVPVTVGVLEVITAVTLELPAVTSPSQLFTLASTAELLFPSCHSGIKSCCCLPQLPAVTPASTASTSTVTPPSAVASPSCRSATDIGHLHLVN